MRANDFYELGDSDFVFLGDDPGGVAAGGAGVAVDGHRSGATAAARWGDAGGELFVSQRYRRAGDDHTGGGDLRLHADRPRQKDLRSRRERGTRGPF